MLLLGPALLVAVIAIAVAGRMTRPLPSAAPVASPAALVAEVASPLSQGAAPTPSPHSDWPAALADRNRAASLAERVNKFTIDDQVVSWSRPDDVPRRTHRIGGLAKY